MQDHIRPLILFLSLGLSPFGARAQVLVCPGEPVRFELGGNYYGTKTWEYSPDSVSWSAVGIEVDSAFIITPERTGWYRVRFHDAECDTTYVSEGIRLALAEPVPIRITTTTPLRLVAMGADPVLTLDRIDDLTGTTYFVDGLPQASAGRFDTIRSPLRDFEVWATAIDGSGCLVHSDTVRFELPDPHLLIPLGPALRASVRGWVTDESGRGLPGATVMAPHGGQSTTTDLNGAFTLPGMDVFETLAYVAVEKPGYFAGSRSFVPAEGENVVLVTLLNRPAPRTFSATAGGSVVLSGLTIAFEPGFMSDGAPYTGTVHVVGRHIAPVMNGFAELMPGMLMGNRNGDATAMISYGMGLVELTTPEGRPVELAPGNTAELRFFVSPAQQSEAPPTIDLWYFDEALGYWIKEGEAELRNNNYHGHVSHFSWWNVDGPAGFVQLSGGPVTITVPGCGAPRPVVGAALDIYEVGASTPRSRIITSTTGHFSGLVMRGPDLRMKLRIPCGNTMVDVHDLHLGRLSASHELQGIEVSMGGLSVVTGTAVDCDGAPLRDGYVTADQRSYFTSPDGGFAVTTCATDLTLRAYDMVNLVAGHPTDITLGGGCVVSDTLEACGIAVPDHVMRDIDGNEYPVVLIGDRLWSASNLRTTRYKDGTAIPNVAGGNQWSVLDSGAWCFYQNNAANDALYGKLYNGFTATDPRGLCPDGWRVPTELDWRELESSLGMSPVDLTATGHRGDQENVGGAMKQVSPLWNAPNTNATNSSGFNGLPGGYRSHSVASFVDLGARALFWTSLPGTGSTTWSRFLYSNTGSVYREFSQSRAGFSVRCIRE